MSRFAWAVTIATQLSAVVLGLGLGLKEMTVLSPVLTSVGMAGLATCLVLPIARHIAENY